MQDPAGELREAPQPGAAADGVGRADLVARVATRKAGQVRGHGQGLGGLQGTFKQQELSGSGSSSRGLWLPTGPLGRQPSHAAATAASARRVLPARGGPGGGPAGSPAGRPPFEDPCQDALSAQRLYTTPSRPNSHCGHTRHHHRQPPSPPPPPPPRRRRSPCVPAAARGSMVGVRAASLPSLTTDLSGTLAWRSGGGGGGRNTGGDTSGGSGATPTTTQARGGTAATSSAAPRRRVMTTVAAVTRTATQTLLVRRRRRHGLGAWGSLVGWRGRYGGRLGSGARWAGRNVLGRRRQQQRS